MHRRNPLFIFLICLMAACAPVIRTGSEVGNTSSGGGGTPNQIYEDAIFADNIQTVRLTYGNDPLYSAVAPMAQQQPLVLSFDVLTLSDENAGTYQFQLIHCNADWRKSNLYTIDYLTAYNEFNITNEAFSVNTKVPYTQFRFQIPPVKMPGNYAIQVYRDNDETDVVFTKRLMIYQPLAGISAEVLRSSSVAERDMRHQIEFLVDYSSLNLPNPLNDVQVVIRQNQQWFNAITGLKPTFVREQDRQLEYRNFNFDNNFFAGNEYRYFDIRTVHAFGQNVADVNLEQVPVEAMLLPDRSRRNDAYSQYQDQNGAFFVENAERRGNELNADYVMTNFLLKADELPGSEVYVTGAFNNRAMMPANRMQYDATLQAYTARILLKQGFYNYMYYVKGEQNPYFFEGNYFQTEDQYEIFVYVRPIGARADLLVGYTSLFSR